MENKSLSTQDINISSFTPIITPNKIRKMVPIKENSINTIYSSRRDISNILNGCDKRKFMIVGPCSIHDPNSALEYANKLLELAQEVKETIVLVMRTYFEKPRTTIGWKGFINDPKLDGSYQVSEGLISARTLLSDITALGLPVSTECLDPITPQYLFEFISWAAIGARTTESQTHREMASGLSAPVGFKNNTDGNIEVAINAIKSAQKPHHFLGIDQDGQTSIVKTNGNPDCHLILRGGVKRPNYDSVSVKMAISALMENKIRPRLVIDCSHDNSLKDYKNQPKVFKDCIRQIIHGNQFISGLMLESNLKEGNQPLSNNLIYGMSITDGCIDFATTKEIIKKAHQELKKL